LDKGEDVRNPKLLIKAKEKKLQQRMKNMTKEERKSNAPKRLNEKFIAGGRSVSQKARNKIVAGSRPTRSKQIIKSGGSSRGRSGSSRGGGGGGRGGRGGRGGKR